MNTSTAKKKDHYSIKCLKKKIQKLMLILANITLVTVAREDALRNAKTGKTKEIGKNSKNNINKNKDLKTNLV